MPLPAFISLHAQPKPKCCAGYFLRGHEKPSGIVSRNLAYIFGEKLMTLFLKPTIFLIKSLADSDTASQ